MITFTDAATEKVREYMDMNETRRWVSAWWLTGPAGTSSATSWPW